MMSTTAAITATMRIFPISKSSRVEGVRSRDLLPMLPSLLLMGTALLVSALACNTRTSTTRLHPLRTLLEPQNLYIHVPLLLLRLEIKPLLLRL